MASLISESRTWRWMFLGALWYLCFLLLERHKGEGFARHVLLIKGILSAEVRPSPQLILPLCHQQMPPMFKKNKRTREKKKLTCFGSPPLQGLWHQLVAALLSPSLPARALLQPPSTECKFSPHTDLSVQPELAAA